MIIKSLKKSENEKIKFHKISKNLSEIFNISCQFSKKSPKISYFCKKNALIKMNFFFIIRKSFKKIKRFSSKYEAIDY